MNIQTEVAQLSTGAWRWSLFLSSHEVLWSKEFVTEQEADLNRVLVMKALGQDEC